MRTETIGGKKYRIPSIDIESSGEDPLRFTITEGKYKGIVFSVSNIRMDDAQDDVLIYDLDLSEPDKIKPVSKIVGNFLIIALSDMVKREEEKRKMEALENQEVTSDPNTANSL